MRAAAAAVDAEELPQREVQAGGEGLDLGAQRALHVRACRAFVRT